jgi:hypothetical protein
MKLISVTRALKPFSDYSRIPPATLEAAAARGNRLHAAAAARIGGTFRVVQLLPEDEGYWRSLCAWIDEFGGHAIDIEPELADPALGFVGHPDLICRLPGGIHAVVDWKTPAVESPIWKSQIAAYRHLADMHYRAYSRQWLGMAVQPRPDGKMAKAILYRHSDRDFAAFLSALNAVRYFTHN